MTRGKLYEALNRPAPPAAICALIAAAAGVFAMLCAGAGRISPSRMVNMAGSDPIATLARHSDLEFRFVTANQHYDGVYYYAMGRDPLLRGDAHRLIDLAPYRYGHPLHGWLAWLVSGGQARWVPLALVVLSLAGLAVAAWAISRLAELHDRTPWAGLAVAFTPGLLYAATISTTETVGVALIACTFLAWLRGRFTLAAVLMVALCLDKEQYVIIPAGFAVYEIAQAARNRGWSHPPVRLAAVLAAGPLALSGWYLYVHATLQAWPWTYEPGNFGAPLAGWRDTMQIAQSLARGGGFDGSQIGSTTPAILAALAVLLIVASVVAVQLRTVFDAPLLGMVAITAMQGWKTMLYPHELVRIPTVAVLLAVAVLGSAHRPADRGAVRRSRVVGTDLSRGQGVPVDGDLVQVPEHAVT